jgi:hypothetical protein
MDSHAIFVTCGALVGGKVGFPASTPYSLKEVSESISYFVAKVLKS